MKKEPTLPQEIARRARDMRHVSTIAEERLWYFLRDRRFMNLKFRRQHPIECYILDFYCPQLKLAIEVDGPTHGSQAQLEYDSQRTEFLRDNGIAVIRFSNYEVAVNIEGVLSSICDLALLQHSKENASPSSALRAPSPKGRRERK